VDLMAGTGSFGIAALVNGRNALIIEQESEVKQLMMIKQRIDEIVEEVKQGNNTFTYLRQVIGD
jgi:16S rRNA G966 N2-methylase RsmD